MARTLVLLCLAVGAFLALPATAALACANAQAGPSAISKRTYTRAVRCLINEQRAATGLSALRRDRRLSRAASGFSTAMVRQGFFDHVAPDGSTVVERARAAGYGGGALAETIGWGAGELATPAAIVSGWMASPPHRSILLDGAYHRIGLGVESGSPIGAPDAATVTADLG
jgi:uncharacterized protein YkwD